MRPAVRQQRVASQSSSRLSISVLHSWYVIAGMRKCKLVARWREMVSSISFPWKKFKKRSPLNATFTYKRVNYKWCRRDCSSSIAFEFDQVCPKWRFIISLFEEFFFVFLPSMYAHLIENAPSKMYWNCFENTQAAKRFQALPTWKVRVRIWRRFLS